MAGLLVVIGMVGAIWFVARRMSERPRTAWKTEALERLASMSLTNERVRFELEELRDPAKTNELGWAHEHVLLMTNGQFIAFEYRHGANELFPPHLFLGRSSSGEWLYSSFHFCREMIAVLYEEPPGSVEEFCRRYAVRKFDGKSDVCLEVTH